jgi:hypothetical protein
MMINEITIVINHPYTLSEQGVFKKTAEKVSAYVNEVHIKENFAVFKEDNVSIIMDENIIQFDFNKSVDDSFLKSILSVLYDDSRNFELHGKLIASIDFQIKEGITGFNHILENKSLENISLELLGFLYKWDNKEYHITVYNQQDKILCTINTNFETNKNGDILHEVDEYLNSIQEGVYPEIKKFIGVI